MTCYCGQGMIESPTTPGWRPVHPGKRLWLSSQTNAFPRYAGQYASMTVRSIGIVWVLPWPDGRYKADLGYALGVNYWGKGIATTAVKIVLSQVFYDFPDLHRLQAFTAVENKASQRVLQKVGFQREGMLRGFFYYRGNFVDLCVFSLLSTDEIPPVV